MIRLFARSLMAALTVGVLAVSHQANAQDSPGTTPFRIFGNNSLGIGRLPLGGLVPSLAGETHTILGQGFAVGATSYDLTSVDIGLYIGEVRPQLDIALYESVFDSAAGLNVPDLTRRVATFNPVPTNNLGVLSLNSTVMYNFRVNTTSGTVRLTNDRNYWVTVSYSPQVSGAPSFLWNYASGRGTDAPREQLRPEGTASGVTYLGTVGKHDFVGNWFNHDATVFPPSGGLSISVNAVDVPVNPGGGGGGGQTPPTLDCYALSKGFFRNKFPEGWPASVIASQGTVIGGRIYTIPQLRTMLATNSTGGNQIGQLASQLVAVHLSRELAKQTAGPNFAGWNGWAPDSAAAQAAYDQAAQLVGANAGFDSQGRLTGTLRNVSSLINTLDDGYIERFHCD